MITFWISVAVWIVAYGVGRQRMIKLTREKRRATDFNRENYL